MSRHEIQFTLSALDDLHVLENYHSVNSPASAHKIRQQIIARISALADYPRIGKSAETLGFFESELRYVAQGKYYIFYSIEETIVQIRRIAHSARDIGTLLAEFDFREYEDPEEFDHY